MQCRNRDILKAGIAIAGMLLILMVMVWFPTLAAGAYEGGWRLATPVAETVQATPTQDATVTELNKEKLAQEVEQLKEQNEPDLFSWFRTNAAVLLSTLVVVIGGLIGLFRWLGDRRDEQEKRREDQRSEQEKRDEEQQRWLKDREAEREKRTEERFQSAIGGLGSPNLATQVGAAIMLRTFLRPGYEQFYSPVFDLAVVYLRLRHLDPKTVEPLDPLSQTLITLFTESFSLARDYLKQSPQFLDATSIQLDNALMKEVDLQHIWMPQAFLREANLREINLHGAELRDTDFFDAALNSSNLSATNLMNASLYKAHLYGANLQGANVSWTQFVEADLTEADLGGADLSGADLSGAKVTFEQLGKAKSLKGVIMPDGSMPNGVYIEADWTPGWYVRKTHQS